MTERPKIVCSHSFRLISDIEVWLIITSQPTSRLVLLAFASYLHCHSFCQVYVHVANVENTYLKTVNSSLEKVLQMMFVPGIEKSVDWTVNHKQN